MDLRRSACAGEAPGEDSRRVSVFFGQLCRDATGKRFFEMLREEFVAWDAKKRLRALPGFEVEVFTLTGRPVSSRRGDLTRLMQLPLTSNT